MLEYCVATANKSAAFSTSAQQGGQPDARAMPGVGLRASEELCRPGDPESLWYRLWPSDPNKENLLTTDGLSHGGKRIYEPLSAQEPRQMDDIVRRTGLNSGEVLATLFNLESKAIVRQLPGKQFAKVLL